MGISLNPSTLLSGQGIDVASLVSQIITEDSGQLTEWQNEQATLQGQASDLTTINTDLTNLATAVNALSDPLGALTAQEAASSNTSVLTGTAQTSALAGVHQIEVGSLATTGTVYTDEVADPTASFLPTGATTGEIDLQVGGATPQPITITAGTNDTLNSLASYINGQNLGVTANVVTDANGSRLALSSTATGAPGALAITSNNTNLTFDTPIGGTNASLTIDGVPYASATNTITGAIPGVTLNLASASPGNAVQVTVGPNVADATAAINSFVVAYNQVITDINQEYAVNPSTGSQGDLAGDASLRQLQSSILTDSAYSLSGNGFVNLASLGISTNDDGTLTVDSTQLASSFASNPAAVQSFFQNSSQTGFANNFSADLTNLTDPTEGILNVDLAANQTEQTDLSTSISNFQTQLTAEQTALTAEYAQVNASLQAYPLLLQQVTETLGTLDTNSSGTSSGLPTLTSGL
jgi:flagellar hook-associated protein 2